MLMQNLPLRDTNTPIDKGDDLVIRKVTALLSGDVTVSVKGGAPSTAPSENLLSPVICYNCVGMEVITVLA